MISMKKTLLFTLAMIVLATFCFIPMTSCGSSASITADGTYYELDEVEGITNEDSWLRLGGKQWSDSDGRTGTYVLTGEDIILKLAVDGEELDYATGSVSGGRLELDLDGSILIYVRE